MVSYGITVPEGAPDRDPDKRRTLREKLGLPVGRPIVLSVGWISSGHKRMDYLVHEMAEVRRRRSEVGNQESQLDPYLVMLGAMDRDSEGVISLARAQLGEENFAARSVSYEQVADYYRAADLFVLASLKEGFGRVFREALIHGLPVIAHDHPVMRYVLGSEGTFGDLSAEGELAGLVDQSLNRQNTSEDARRRRESVRSRFSWLVLAPQYRAMFYDCFEKVKPF